MPLESYEELRNVDIKKYCKKRDGLDYLNWATCINLLRMHGADKVYWEPVPDPVTGSSLSIPRKSQESPHLAQIEWSDDALRSR